MNRTRYISIEPKYNSIAHCGHTIFKYHTCYYDKQKKVIYCDVCGQRLAEREARENQLNLLERMRLV
jgi:transcription elongation factor Elf1